MMRTISKRRGVITLLLMAALVLSACGSPAGTPETVTVNVTLTEFKITSSVQTFHVGVPYHFVVTNNGTVEHEFYIMPPESAQITQDQVKQDALAGIPPAQLQPEQTATLDYTFTKAAPSGTLEFACHLPGHYDAGMHFPITVQSP
jgi:uncharacterized cupredoxin-like copper-binding protein